MKVKLRIRVNTLNILLFLIGVFSPVGSGLSKLLKFDISKFFLVLVTLLFVYRILKRKIRVDCIPTTYLVYIGFVILHTIIFSFILFPNELFSLTVAEEYKLVGLIRFFFMLSYSILLAVSIKEKKQIRVLLLGYIIGYLVSFFIGMFYLIELIGTPGFRISGGFENPNSFGVSSIIFIFSVFYIYIISKKRNLILYLVLLLTGIFGLLLSESRSALLGLTVGVIGVFMKFITNRRILTILILVTIAFVVSYILFVPKELKKSLGKRFDIAQRIESGHESRIFVWTDYMKNIHKYALQGYGRGRVTKITEDNYTSRTNYATHNKYLNVLAEFGVLGLFLFLVMFRSLYLKITSSDMPFEEQILGRIFLLCWLILMLFGDYTNSRDFWMSIGILTILGYPFNRNDEEESSNSEVFV